LVITMSSQTPRPGAAHPDRSAPGLGSRLSFATPSVRSSPNYFTYVRGCLVPTLQPGDIVIMDNLGSHRGKAVRKAIREAGARLLFLPKYSPDLNPIEQVFAKLKHLLRKARARSYDGLLQATAELLDTFLPNECAAYLRNSGYAA
jgi:transposase